MTLRFPDGRTFAFTIMDDTDVSTLENVGPIYRLLAELGFRTTKTVWPFAHTEGHSNFRDSDTLEREAYVEFAHWLASAGFEIAYHGASMESSRRARTQRGLERFRALFGSAPRVYANHAYNQENLYWGTGRIDDALLRAIYARTEGRPPGFYQGHVPGSEWWWGDLATELTYVRNLTFADINTLRHNPSMPYHDPRRAVVQRWFSASDAESVHEFNELINPSAQARLQREGGVCIVATHLGKGFVSGGAVHARTEALLRQLAARPGWFVPIGELLDWLASQRRGSTDLPGREWRAMQWRWAWDLLTRNLRRRVKG